MNYQEYIKPELLILIPVLYLVGIAIKKSQISDRLIPLILGTVSVLFSGLYIIATENIVGIQAVATAIFTALTQGILIAGASVYANELITQARKDE